MKKNILISLSCLVPLLFYSCGKNNSDQEMLTLLEQVRQKSFSAENPFSSSAKLKYVDSLLSNPNLSSSQVKEYNYYKATYLLELGREDEAIEFYNKISIDGNEKEKAKVLSGLALSYLRKGERSNCIDGHAAESCIIPLKGMGIHQDEIGSRQAIALYQKILTQSPDDLESMWLLNIAYMTLNEYPSKVPAAFLLPNMDGDTTVKVSAFQDIASSLKLDVHNMAGGSIVDDFDNDGYLDIVTSSMDLDEEMHYFKNNADGKFSDRSKISGLSSIRGGLNISQADYDNDGDIDILVLRGAWKRRFGEEPNSLLENNGDGTFTDVTTVSGLLSFNPTQTATWNDFNNDGWLDLFIGNETVSGAGTYPCELYINNQNGSFRNIAAVAKCDYKMFVKGVASGDYNNDGWKDIFISTLDGKRVLLKNNGLKGREISFTDVTHEAGIDKSLGNSFTTWFWDYDNDGWLDIFACGYAFNNSLAVFAAAEKINREDETINKIFLYHNNHDGTFTNMAKEMGLNKVTYSMGGNFGDIDNDGWLDMYLGTGNPQYQSLIPNKMYMNMGAKKFADVTASARVGHLQKGHGVSFADMDNDGDQDIYIEMGGAYKGDAYANSFFLNPGQSDNNWICLSLVGKKSNRDGIGARVKITVNENGTMRNIYRDVNSGGSFGSSPLRREIGIGKATNIEDIEITWPNRHEAQHFKNVKPNQFIRITEGNDDIERIQLKKLEWILTDPLCLPTPTATAAKKS